MCEFHFMCWSRNASQLCANKSKKVLQEFSRDHSGVRTNVFPKQISFPNSLTHNGKRLHRDPQIGVLLLVESSSYLKGGQVPEG
jgi:hypothetical protein